MSDRVELIVKGTPAARPRPRTRAVQLANGKWVGRIYQPKRPGRTARRGDKAWAKANAWYEAVKVALWQCANRPVPPWEGPVSLTVDCYFERPQRLCRKCDPDGPIRHTAKPDRDNLDKSIMDALTEAGLFLDDGQACDGPVRKWYAAKGHAPGVIIVAERLVDDAGTPLFAPG